MSSLGGRIGVVFLVAAALACTKRPLDPVSEPDTGVQPHDAAPSVGMPDAGATDHPREAIEDWQGRDASTNHCRMATRQPTGEPPTHNQTATPAAR